MTKEIWFAVKEYGWGWTPANGKGWLATLAFMLSVGVYPLATHLSESEFSIPTYVIITVLLSAAFIFLCYKKGEKPSWRWGDKS